MTYRGQAHLLAPLQAHNEEQAQKEWKWGQLEILVMATTQTIMIELRERCKANFSNRLEGDDISWYQTSG